ncbi:MAG: dihydrolipoamide acetyltransferase family protein [Polyangiales bacterium]
MSTDYLFKLPDLGEGMTEGEIVEWHVAVGDRVEEDGPLLEVMTDKATVSIGAPCAGWVRELRFGPGDIAKVGEVLVVIGRSDAEDASTAPTRAASVDDAPRRTAGGSPTGSTGGATPAAPAATAVGDLRDVLPGAGYFRDRVAHEGDLAPGRSDGASGDAYFEAKPLATPAVRALAKELDVDLRHVRPSGALSRVLESDVRQHAAASNAAAVASEPSTVPRHGQPSNDRRRGAAVVAPPLPPPHPDDVRRPFVGVRRRIADRLQASARSAVHFTFVEEVDVEPLIARRAALQPQAAAVGVKLTFMPFIVQAVVRGLAAHPVLNSYLDEGRNELVTRGAQHIGVAAATDAGLLVPVVRDANTLDLLATAREIERLAEGARVGSLRSDELSGSTFTVSSLGKLGGLLATPVLNYPEVGILGVHRIKDKPVVRHGAVVPGKLMMLSFSFDHRVIDGHVGASFAYAVIDALEHPASLP